MNTIAQINKDREYQANLILEKIEEIYEELQIFDDEDVSWDELCHKIKDYINKEHLFKS